MKDRWFRRDPVPFYVIIPGVAFFIAVAVMGSCATEDGSDVPPVEIPAADTVDVPPPVPPPAEEDTTDVALECPAAADCPDCPPDLGFRFTESDLEGCFENLELGFLLCAVL